VRQAAERTLHPATLEGVRIERLALQIDSAEQGRMQFGNRRRPLLARGHGLNARVRVSQQDLDQFGGGVTRSAEDGNFGHFCLAIGQ
jgi:hypothetical protein